MKGALSSTALTLHISSKGLQSKGLPAISYSASPCLHKCKLLFLSFLTAATCIMRCAMAIGFTFRVTSVPPWTRFSFHTSLCARSCQSQDDGPSACAPAAFVTQSRGIICRYCQSYILQWQCLPDCGIGWGQRNGCRPLSYQLHLLQ